MVGRHMSPRRKPGSRLCKRLIFLLDPGSSPGRQKSEKVRITIFATVSKAGIQSYQIHLDPGSTLRDSRIQCRGDNFWTFYRSIIIENYLKRPCSLD